MNLRGRPNKITKKVLIQAFARSSCDSKVFFVIQVFGWHSKSAISLRFPIFVKKAARTTTTIPSCCKCPVVSGDTHAHDSDDPILL